MDDVQEICTLSKTSTGQRRHRNMGTAFCTHVTHQTGHYVGTGFSSTLSAPRLAHPCFQQRSWESVFLPTLRPGDTHSHETRFRGTDVARFQQSKAFSQVAVLGNWKESHPEGGSVHATNIDTPVSSGKDYSDTRMTSTARTSEVLVARTKPRSYTSGIVQPGQRVPRPARPSYSQEQKFFIMYYRVVKQESWGQIGERFKEFFGLRTKDGLNSVYYRIRHEWDMKPVLDASADDSETDRLKVEEMAKMVSLDFLQKIGYWLDE